MKNYLKSHSQTSMSKEHTTHISKIWKILVVRGNNTQITEAD